MHKDISGVLTVSTCLLNRDRNSVSDFTETPPPHGATCVLLYLASPLPASDSAADNPHLEKKKRTCLQRCQPAMVKAQGQSCSSAGTSASLPACLPACSSLLHSMNIGYPHCEINNAFSYIFFYSHLKDVGHSIASVKPAPASELSKVKGLRIFFFFFMFCQREVRSCQGY